MKFGAVPVSEAEGAILAHSAEAVRPNGQVYRMRKGTNLEAQHLTDLVAAGAEEIVVARLGPKDVHEDEAATQLAKAVVGEQADINLEATGAATGRVNIRAKHAGIVEVAAERIHAANRVDPGITIATVAPYQKVAKGGLVATIKIIPYAVTSDALTEACDCLQQPFDLCVPRFASATLIETRVGSLGPQKGREAIKDRLDFFGITLSEQAISDHEIQAIVDKLRSAPGQIILILTGSATSDVGDTAPEALRQAGGEVIHYGMPVDPGNLLFLGRLEEKPVIGLPGCARSPALNGADWVLERIICGIPVQSEGITEMGVGGLLKEIPTRPRPRSKISSDEA